MNAGGYGPAVGQADAQREVRLLALLGGGTYVPNCYLEASIASSALTVRLLNAAGQSPTGANPVIAAFHDSNAAVGKPMIRRIASRVNLTIPSTATMGFANGTAGKLWFVLFDDVTTGQQRLGVINCLTGVNIFPLGAWPIASSTATPASSAHVFYTDAAVVSMPYVVLGSMTWESGLSVAGTWDALPTRVRMYGPGVPLPGQVIQSQKNQTGAVATGTTTLPDDDTIPQNTEGVEFITQAITPTSKANVFAVGAQATGANSNGGSITIAIFQDTTAGALAAMQQECNAGNVQFNLSVDYRMAVNVAAGAATTFKMRVGSDAAGTITLNGVAAARRLGGVLNSFLAIAEIAA